MGVNLLCWEEKALANKMDKMKSDLIIQQQQVSSTGSDLVLEATGFVALFLPYCIDLRHQRE